jgi:hypothetical protein
LRTVRTPRVRHVPTDNENIAIGRLWDGIDLATAIALME